MVSKAQQRLMYAAAAKPGGVAGVSQKVAKEFVAAGKAETNLPDHVGDKKNRSSTGVAAKKNWIKKGASKHPGLFGAKAKKAGLPTAEFAAEHEGDSGKLGKEARFAENAMRASHKARQKKLYTNKE